MSAVGTRRLSRARAAVAFALAACAWALVANPRPVAAQAVWLDRSRPHTIQLEILKPDPQGADALSFSTSAWYFSGRVEFSPGLHGIAELPLATAGYQGEFSEGVMVGNPYIGLEFGSAPSVVLGELGLRLPLAGGSFTTLSVGLVSDVDRWPAWFPEITTLRAGVRLRSRPGASGVWVEGRVASELWAGTGEFVAMQVQGTYGFNVRLDRPAVRAGAGASGRISLPDFDGGDLGRATLHQFEFAADFLEGRVRPGVSLRLPLDEALGDEISAVYGLSVSYAP